MRHSLLRLALVCVLALATFTAVAHGQGSFFSTLSGTVVDISGGVIPGADVKVKNNGTGAESNTVTAVNGTFSIPSLPGGSYSVTVSLSGFKTKVLSEVSLAAAVPASVRVVLELGAIEESITVVGESSSVVQTVTPAVATTITSTQILRFPAGQPERAGVARVIARVQHASRDASVDDQWFASERDQYHARWHEHPGQLPEDDRRLLRAPESSARRGRGSDGDDSGQHG